MHGVYLFHPFQIGLSLLVGWLQVQHSLVICYGILCPPDPRSGRGSPQVSLHIERVQDNGCGAVQLGCCKPEPWGNNTKKNPQLIQYLAITLVFSQTASSILFHLLVDQAAFVGYSVHPNEIQI